MSLNTEKADSFKYC